MNPLTNEEKALVEESLPFAQGVVDNYLKKIPFAAHIRDDLMQVASLATMQAAKAWRPDRGASFKTYLFNYVISRVRRAIRSDFSSDMSWFPKSLGFKQLKEPEGALLNELAAPTVSFDLEDPEFYAEVKKSVLELEKKRRKSAGPRVEAFFAVSFEGKTARAIAKERGTTPQSVSLQKKAVQKSFDVVAATYRSEG